MSGPVCGQERVISPYLQPRCVLPAGHGGGFHVSAGRACTWAVICTCPPGRWCTQCRDGGRGGA